MKKSEQDLLIGLGGLALLAWLLNNDRRSCPRCNYPVQKGTPVCPNCGQPLSWEER